jgi:hypothetical protein
MPPSSFRDVTLPQLVRRTFALYGASVLPAVPVALAMNLPLLLLGGLPMEPDAGSPGGLLAALLLVLVCSGIAVSAVTRVLLGAAAGTAVSFRRLLRLTFGRSLVTVTATFAATSFVSNIGLLGFLFSPGLLVLVVPGLILGGLFAAAVPAVLVERRSSVAAIGRSAGLMRQDLVKAMAAFSFGALASELLPLGLLVGLQSVAGPSPFSPLLAVTINAITLPLALAVGVALYTAARAAEAAGAGVLQAELARAAGGAEPPSGP